MSVSPFAKAGLLAAGLLFSFVVGWELYLRSQGFLLSYNDDEALWAHHRQRVYQATDANPVIIGSSRVKFGLDLSTWEATTGSAPTQLAMVGTSPRPLLADLAQDPAFKGTVVVGVTEGLFFAPAGSPPVQQARKSTSFYPKWSPAQRFGFTLNRFLESHLLFLDEDRFSLNGLLKQMRVANRPGVFALPAFPQKFTTADFDRQTFMTPDFLADTAMQNRQRAIWVYIFTKAPRMPMPDSVLTGIFNEMGAHVAKIQGRGGHVLFARMPSTNTIWEVEKQVFPRKKYWDRLLQETGAPGIHFEDYPELSKYACPEWSHLSPADAKMFTRDFIRIMEQKTGWPISQAEPRSTHSATSTLTAR